MVVQQPVTQVAISCEAIIEIHSRLLGLTEIAAGSWVRAGSTVNETKVGKSCFVGFRSALNFAEIGDGTMLAARVNLHGTPDRRIHIGRHAWLGANVTVGPGVTIGDGAVIAAGALVTRNIPEDVIAVGRPARVLSNRNVNEDGFPNPAPILNRMRQRARNGGPSFCSESSVSPERAIFENGIGGWSIDKSALIDAELGGGSDVSIGGSCILIGRSTRTGGISPRGGIYLEDMVNIEPLVVMEGAGGLHVGERCIIEKGVTIVTSTHNHHFRSLPWVEAPVTIGPGCIIGEGAVIVGPVSIGAGAIVAAHAVVIRDVRAGDKSSGIVSVKEDSK